MEGDVNHERLWTLKSNLRVLKGRGRWEVGGTRWWVLERAQIAWSTGCDAKTMNTATLKKINIFFKRQMMGTKGEPATFLS